jgi:hypothetical protein
MTRPVTDRGIALVLALLAIAFFSAMAGGLVLSSLVGRSVAANYEEATELANISDSALELAARELASIADWNDVLTGGRTSTLIDGIPCARRLPDGTNIDLVAMTNERTCGRAGACTDGQRGAYTLDRPWGPNNPRWRLFIHTPSPPLPPSPRPAGPAYVVVWIGDDARETDDDPATDGAGAGQEGRYVVRARVESFGARGGRHALEAELARVCTVDEAGEHCRPGTRVHSWRIAAIP